MRRKALKLGPNPKQQASKEIWAFASVLDYEAHMLARSLYNEIKQGQVPPKRCAVSSLS
jgi:hypothetical protein